MSADSEIYESSRNAPTAGSSGLHGRVRELYEYRYLLQNLVVRDLKVRYKNSFLGVVWSLLNPLLLMVVFSLVFSRFGGDEIRQYAVFFLVGLMPWNFFSGALLTGTTSITNSSGIIKKVYFPRELLPLSAILSNLVNFGFTLIVLLIFLYGSGIGLTIHALWVPVIIFTQIVFTLGLAMFLGAINVFYRDVLMILDVVMLAWFFLTPIMYPFELFNSMSPLVIGDLVLEPARVMRWLNPMASIIDGYRTVLWGTMTSEGPVSMNALFLLRTFVTSLIVFVVGYVTFMRLHGKFGEKL